MLLFISENKSGPSVVVCNTTTSYNQTGSSADNGNTVSNAVRTAVFFLNILMYFTILNIQQTMVELIKCLL